MKHLYLTLTLLLFLFSSKAQTIFHEDFENPDSVVSSGNPGWNLNSDYQTSGLFCDSGSAAVGDSSMLTTIPFSTLGQYNVKLSFNHIFNSEGDQGTVWVSNNGGASWTQLTNNEHEGLHWFGSNYFASYSFKYFILMGGGGACGMHGNTIWQEEVFNLSSLCSNQASVQVKFVLSDKDSVSCNAWLIDDLKIRMAPYSIVSTITCGNNGTATMTPYYGSAPYSYSWNSSPIQTTQTATGLSHGTYVCTVTDASGTYYTDSVNVSSVITAAISASQPQCGLNNGSVTIFNVWSPNLPYNYSWSTGAISSSITNLSPGIYTAYITDAAGCLYQQTFPLPCGYNANNLTITKTPSLCNAPTGTATVQSFIPATPPFTYQWITTPIQTTQTATGLPGQTYIMVWVKDANNDSALSYIFIPYNDTIIAAATYTPTACNGSTGTATASGIGGVQPYTYLWSTVPLQTTTTATGLGSNFYTITVTDANGCTDDQNFTVPYNVTMYASVYGNGTTCGQSTGTANAYVSGGATPYTYFWSTIPIQSNSTATGLSVGSYSVVITDNSGCSVTKYVYIPKIPTLTITINYLSAACNCVNATASVTGGNAPYTYYWDDGQTTQTDSCITLGWHYVNVTDANGCTDGQNVYVSYPANCFVTVQGDVYADLNNNCVHDAGEYNIANVQLSLVGSNYSFYTNTDNTGHYYFHVLNDNYTLTQYVPTHWNQLCPITPNTYNINVASGTNVSLDFADSADSYFDDASIYSCWSGPNTRGFNSQIYTYTENKGTTMLSGNVVVVHDPVMAYIGSSPGAVYNVGAQTVNWSYTNLIPGAYAQYNFWALIPAATPLGTLLLDSTYITPIATDVNTLNNYCDYNGTVNGSYDPNIKTVSPDGYMHKDSLEHLYSIHFQNTGNSPALRVIVEDTLDANLEISTMSNVISSHAFTVDSSAKPVVKFIFDNINLPDSNQNEPQSHGYVNFKIKHKAGLTGGTVIKNTGYIYFDFNAPVITNTVNNTLYEPGGIPEYNKVALHIFPNPAHDELNVMLGVTGINSKPMQPNLTLTLCDITGRIIKAIPFYHASPTDVNKLSVKSISKGIYFLKVTDANNLQVASDKVVVN